MIELIEINQTYSRNGNADVHALRDISFRVDAGEFVVVRGASGSGKSTLLNVLGCLDRPTVGSYILQGNHVSGLSEQELSRVRCEKIGFVFQSFNLLPRTTAVENVELPMVYSHGRVERKRALAALERVGLADRGGHYATELSGGEQQRVAIARALINNPMLILADEPTGNLDAKSGKEIMRLLADLNTEGRTIILVTHDDAVASYAKRQLLLSDGALVSDTALQDPMATAPAEGLR